MNLRNFKIGEHIPGTEARRARIAREAAIAAMSSMSYADYVRQQPHGPGLLGVDVDWKLYRNLMGTEAGHSRQALTGRASDFWDTQMSLLRQHLELPSTGDVPLMSQIHSGTSPALSQFLQKHRYPNAFFTPEMVQEAVADVPEIIIDRGEANGVEVWNFTTQNGDGDIEKLTLVRAGENPTVRTAPYFAVTYTAEYDAPNQDILFVPRPIMDSNDGINDSLPRRDSALVSRINAALGLEAQVVHQPLSFTVNSQPYRFLTAPETFGVEAATAPRLGEFAMGQIPVPGRVVVDLA